MHTHRPLHLAAAMLLFGVTLAPIPAFAAGVPLAPSKLAAVTTSSSTIDLTWQNNAADATASVVLRSTDGATFTTVATLPATATGYSDSGLSADTGYWYEVYATGAGGDSAPTAPTPGSTIPAFAHTIWVNAATGKDTNPGTFTAPMRSINAALQSSTVVNTPAGTGIVVRAGGYKKAWVYREKVTVPSGGPGAPLTLMGTPNERVVLSGLKPVIYNGWTAIGGGIHTTTLDWLPNTLYVDHTPQPLAGSPDPGQGLWAASSYTVTGTADPYTVTITDTAHLTSIGDVVGGFVYASSASTNNGYKFKIVSQDKAAGTITAQTFGVNPAGAPTGALKANDRYALLGAPSLITQPGEWAVTGPDASGRYTLYFYPRTSTELTLGNARYDGGAQIQVVSGGAHDIVIRDLEVSGNRSRGIAIVGGLDADLNPQYASNITVDHATVTNTGDSIVTATGGAGIAISYGSNVTVRRSSIFANANGIAVSHSQNVVIDSNEIAFNTTDGIQLYGDEFVHTPGQPGFTPDRDIVISNNYIHNHHGYGHADNIQACCYTHGTVIRGNLLRTSGQGIIVSETDYDGTAPTTDSSILEGNAVLGASSYTVRFDHKNAFNWNVRNNTVGAGGGFGPYVISASGYQMNDNLNLGRVAIPSVSGCQYTGDRNFYYVPTAPAMLGVGGTCLATSYTFKNYNTTSAFYAEQGQEQHSLSANNTNVGGARPYPASPLANAPLLGAGVKDRSLTTTTTDPISGQTQTTVNLWSVAGFAAGDHVEVGGDGVVRTIVAGGVDTTNKKITFTPGLPTIPLTDSVYVDNWLASTDYALDLTVVGPAATMSATGGPVGATIDAADYIAADFDGDGRRDTPTLFANVVKGLPSPNNWLLPPVY